MTPNTILNLSQSHRMVDVLRQGLMNSDRADICVSFLRFSGLNLLLKELIYFRDRGGKLKLLTSTYLNVTQPEALEVLMGFPEIEIRLQDGCTGFHTKFYFFSKRQHSSSCWIGSSNLTKGGLSTNIEWNVKHNAPDIIEECNKNFDNLWQREDVFPLTFEVLSAYKEKLEKTQFQVVNFTLANSSLTSEEEYKPNQVQQEALTELGRVIKSTRSQKQPDKWHPESW